MNRFPVKHLQNITIFARITRRICGACVYLTAEILCRNWFKMQTNRENRQNLSWKCCRFRCRPQLVLKTCLRVFPTRRPDTADVSATSCDVRFFFSVSYVVSVT